ncbi:MAG: glutamate dehydrogenase [Pseudonocardiales bacterium]|nr:glutamate dehydrogenase [Pseudonocardiales bacterium]MDT7671062.1 glutamate dehydrogenase [Pseudonocardiales bacterium]
MAVYSPDYDEHGFASQHTVVEVVTDDMPFLVDSLTMELRRHGLGLHVVIHPVLTVRRDGDGELLGIVADSGDKPTDDAVVVESYHHVEVDRQTDPAVLDEIRRDLVRVLGDVIAAVTDWPDDPKEIVRRGYDAVSERYRADSDAPSEYETWLQALTSRLPASAQVLDLGCGCGSNTTPRRVPTDRIRDRRGPQLQHPARHQRPGANHLRWRLVGAGPGHRRSRSASLPRRRR